MMTLTLVFSEDKKFVLMCLHRKQNRMNYIGGKVEECEDNMTASYRELGEETGITKDDVDLRFVREEHATIAANNGFSNVFGLYVTAGILKRDVEIKDEKNPTTWISIDDLDTIAFKTMGFGNCYTYLCEAMDVLGIGKE